MNDRLDLQGGLPIEELPVYPLARAAHLVRVPPSTLHQWATGDDPHEALFNPAVVSPVVLSFSNLVEAFVVASMRRVHNLSMQQVRKVLRFVSDKLGYVRPLLHARFRTDGVRLFVQHADRLLDVSAEGQSVLRALLDESLERIDWEAGRAARLYPWVRAGERAGQPRSIVIDPRRSAGQPTIAGTSIEARAVAGRHGAGESMLEIARDYNVSLDLIEDAIRYEAA